MSSYAQLPLIDGFVDAVADLVCSDKLHGIREIGIFQDVPPATDHRTVATAIRHVDGHLGLAQWSLTPLYVEGKKRLRADPSDFKAASAMLLASPDYLTAWNVRKRQLLPSRVTDELLLNSLILMRSPKSAETWAHRSWVLRKFGCPSSHAQSELQLTWMAASRAPSNYYAGVHRLRVVDQAPNDYLLSELDRSRKWLRTNVSDSSGWWYHRHLVSKLTALGMTQLDSEVAYSSELFERYCESHQCIRIQWQWVVALRKAQQDVGKQ